MSSPARSRVLLSESGLVAAGPVDVLVAVDAAESCSHGSVGGNEISPLGPVTGGWLPPLRKGRGPW